MRPLRSFQWLNENNVSFEKTRSKFIVRVLPLTFLSVPNLFIRLNGVNKIIGFHSQYLPRHVVIKTKTLYFLIRISVIDVPSSSRVESFGKRD